MKKINLFLILSCILFSIIFSSCQEAVFYGITQDVSPEEATVSGAVTTIVRYKVGDTDLYISSGLGTSLYKFRLFNRPSINFYRITNN